MLAFKFQLTPAQVEFLLTCYAGRYKGTPLLPDFDSSWFVPIARKLISSGLLSHDVGRCPTYQITDKGISIARMIVDDAKKIAACEYVPIREVKKLTKVTK